MVLSPIISSLRPESRAVSLARLHASFALGMTVVVVGVTAGLHFGAGWRTLVLVAAGVPLAAAAGFTRSALPGLHGGDLHRTGLRVLLRHRSFRVALVVMSACGAAGAGVAQWLPAYAEQALGLSRTVGGYGLLAMAMAMTAGRLAAGEWSRRSDPVIWMVAGSLLSAFLAGAATMLPWPGPALAALALIGFTAGGMWPGVLAATADQFPHGGGSLFGILSAAGNTGCMIMPWVIGLLADAVGLRIALLAVIIPFVVYAMLVPRLKEQGMP